MREGRTLLGYTFGINTRCVFNIVAFICRPNVNKIRIVKGLKGVIFTGGVNVGAYFYL